MSAAYTPSRFHVVYTAPAWMPLYERVLLHALTVGLAPRAVLEIGTFEGGSTLLMCAALDDLGGGRIVCVDPDSRIADETWEAIRHRAVMVAKPSPEAVSEAREVAGEPFDFALIDGDHSFAGVGRDIDATVPTLADEAHVIFHDAHYFQVRDGIDAALERYTGQFEDAGFVSRADKVEHGERWGGLRLLRFRRR